VTFDSAQWEADCLAAADARLEREYDPAAGLGGCGDDEALEEWGKAWNEADFLLSEAQRSANLMLSKGRSQNEERLAHGFACLLLAGLARRAMNLAETASVAAPLTSAAATYRRAWRAALGNTIAREPDAAFPRLVPSPELYAAAGKEVRARLAACNRALQSFPRAERERAGRLVDWFEILEAGPAELRRILAVICWMVRQVPLLAPILEARDAFRGFLAGLFPLRRDHTPPWLEQLVSGSVSRRGPPAPARSALAARAGAAAY